MAKSKTTSGRVASTASEILRNPRSSQDSKSVAGSALSQRQINFDIACQRSKMR